MIKKLLSRSLLISMLVLASCFCAFGFKNNALKISPILESEVFASEIVELDVQSGTGFIKGSVTGEGSYPVGSTVTLTATPAEGCKFVKWQIWDTATSAYIDVTAAGGNLIVSESYSFVIEQNTKIKAVFEHIEYKVNNCFPAYLEINSVDFEYDSNRFSADDLVNFPRADETNLNTGNFYYNDIVSLKFNVKDGTYLKELASNNFTLNKRVMLIAINESGEILYTETAGSKSTIDQNTPISAYDSYDYSIYDYIIATNKLVDAKYITTKVEVKACITNDLNLSMTNQTELQVLTLSAKLDDGTDLDINEVSSCIVFDNGYYAKTTGENTEKMYYLIQDGNNFKFTISDNLIYDYQYAVGSTTYDQNPIYGTFSGMSELVFYFKKISYAVNFRQILNGGTSVDTEWLEVENVELYPGQSLEAKFDNANKYVKLFDSLGGEISTSNIVENAVYGFRFVGFSESDFIDVSLGADNSVITHTIDSANPTSATIYVVLEEIEYTMHFGVADSDGVYSEYFTSKFKNLPESRGYTRGDSINLTAEIPTGYNKIGWIMVSDGQSYDIDFTNFTFIPTTNEVTETYFYLKVEYITFSLTLSLNGFNDTGDNVAKIGLNIIEYFTLNNAKDTLTIHGSYCDHDTLGGFLMETASSPVVAEKTLTFSSALGDIVVYLDDDSNPKSLKFNSYTFTYRNDKFIRNYSEKRLNVNYETKNDAEPRLYSVKLTNVCVDDIIYASTFLTDTNYRFAHYVNAAKTHVALESRNATFNGKDNVHLSGSTYTTDTTIIVTCLKRDSSVSIGTSNEFAYSVGNIECDIVGSGSINFTAGNVYKLANVGSGSLKITITKSYMTCGFKFVGFDVYLVGGDIETYALGNAKIEVSTNAYIFTLAVSSVYEDSRVVAVFEEINYTVKFETSANIEVRDDENNSLLSGKSFVLNWSVLDSNPTLSVDSSFGHYIKNAYYAEDIDVNRILSLVGEESSQTSKTYQFDQNKFENYVIGLANGSNEVTIYLVEDNRTFSITLEYSMTSEEEQDYAKFVSAAITKCGYDSTIVEKHAIYGQIGPKFVYYMIFEGIPYESAIAFEMNDSMIEGTYFVKWQIEGGDSSTENVFNFTLNGDMYVYAYFNTINYAMNFVTYNNEDPFECGSATVLVNGEANSSYKIGDQIQLNISEYAGYAFARMYYIKGGVTYEGDGITFVSKDEDKYVYSIEEFIPSNFLSTLRDEQLANYVNGKLVLHLVFEEKLFTISVEAKNSGRDNSTGIGVEDWIENDKLQILYFNDESGTYVEQTADPDGNIYYNTNSLIEIRFNSSFKGIEFVKLYLGGDVYPISKTGITEIAGQEVSLLVDDSKGNNYYILRFELNSNVLETIGTSDNFNVSVVYKIKTYEITFSTNKINEKQLSEEYSVKLVMTVKDVSEQSSTSAITRRGVSFGKDIAFAVNSGTSINDFNKKYYFRHFYCVVDGKIISFKTQEPSITGESGTSFSFTTSEQFYDSNANPFYIWDMIAENSEPTIYAYYEPKITFGEGFEYREEYTGFVKNVTYNGQVQKLTSSADVGVTTPDIIYATELGGINITYTLGGGSSVEPKNANTYIVSIQVNGVSFSGKVYLIINKAKLEFQYSNAPIIKEYDGTTNLTGDNILTLQNNFTLVGLHGTDIVDIVVNSVSGYYSTHKVGTKIDVTVLGLSLGSSLTDNYFVDEGVSSGITITMGGTITKKELSIDRNLFTFNNMVYKADQEYVLNYTTNGEIKFRETLPDELNDECYIDLNILAPALSDYSIGENKAIILNLSAALDGADKDNYYINDMTYYINIHPYQLVFVVEDYGRFTITDFDELCIIPIDTSLEDFSVEIINSNNIKYPNMYEIVENIISRTEKVHSFYEFTIKTKKGNIRDVKDFKGAYITFSKVKDLTSVYDIAEDVNKLSTSKKDNDIVIKIEEDSSNTIGVFVDKSYFAIWRIVLIVGLLLLLLLIIVIIVIIYKKTRKKSDDKIY